MTLVNLQYLLLFTMLPRWRPLSRKYISILWLVSQTLTTSLLNRSMMWRWMMSFIYVGHEASWLNDGRVVGWLLRTTKFGNHRHTLVSYWGKVMLWIMGNPKLLTVGVSIWCINVSPFLGRCKQLNRVGHPKVMGLKEKFIAQFIPPFKEEKKHIFVFSFFQW